MKSLFLTTAMVSQVFGGVASATTKQPDYTPPAGIPGFIDPGTNRVPPGDIVGPGYPGHGPGEVGYGRGEGGTWDTGCSRGCGSDDIGYGGGFGSYYDGGYNGI